MLNRRLDFRRHFILSSQQSNEGEVLQLSLEGGLVSRIAIIIMLCPLALGRALKYSIAATIIS